MDVCSRPVTDRSMSHRHREFRVDTHCLARSACARAGAALHSSSPPQFLELQLSELVACIAVRLHAHAYSPSYDQPLVAKNTHERVYNISLVAPVTETQQEITTFPA